MRSGKVDRIFCPCAFTHQNKGDALLVSTLLEVLRKRYGSEAHITVASLHPDIDRDWYGVPVGPEPLRRFRDAGGTNWAPVPVIASWLFVAVAALWARFPSVARILPREWRFVLDQAQLADLAVAVPGGYLMAPRPEAFWWLSHFCALWACVAAGKPVVLSPCSIGPFAPRYRPLARLLLRSMDLIVLRESRSLRFLQELGVDESRVRVAADMAFAQPQEDRPSGLAGEPPVVGISVRHWDFPGHPDPASRWEGYLHAMAALADWLVKERGARVVLLPQSLGSGGDDPAVSRAVRERSERSEAIEVVEADLGLDELRDLYGSLDLLIGTRMHANLIALTRGVPVVAVAYEVKTRGIMEQLGLEDYVVDISSVRADELIRLVGEAWSVKDEIRERVARGVEELRHRAVAWMEELDGLVIAGTARR